MNILKTQSASLKKIAFKEVTKYSCFSHKGYFRELYFTGILKITNRLV